MNWIISKRQDLIFLFAPVWCCWLLAFQLSDRLLAIEAPLWVWVIFVLGIDVSHVWSTLFRTYLDKEEFRNHKHLLIWAPMLSLLAGIGIASFSTFLFWRILAYVAVFHFIKQQFGFMKIYKARAGDFKKQWISDSFVIYFSMLYPLCYWHLASDRHFSWFVTGDFIHIPLDLEGLSTYTNGLFFLILGVWLVQEIRKEGGLAIGKVLWILTTAGNWFLGIIYFNSDVVFTITNVVAHGIPYMALILFYQNRKAHLKQRVRRKVHYVASLLAGILSLAFLEEYFWDILVNQEKSGFFASILPYFQWDTPEFLIGLFTAILAVPQMTHYIIDGYIWKNDQRNPYLKPILFGK